ncbi:hypothetical protein [Micrococcus luteus]|uniref:hypothetical protein n=1 Tax=Micrococcus luteus TaxID=1270 RepID=UPI0036A13CD4
MTRYATRDEAIEREVIAPIEAGDVEDARAEFDVEAIADTVLQGHGGGYALRSAFTDEATGPEEFWAVVLKHSRRAPRRLDDRA